MNALPPPDLYAQRGSIAMTILMRFGAGLALLLLLWVAGTAGFGLYVYWDTYVALTQHFSEATAHFLAVVVLVLGIALPIRSVLRILARRSRPQDLLVVLVLPMITWAIAMIPDDVGNIPVALAGDPSKQVYFVQGRPVVWFSGASAGKACPVAWDRSGHHPQTNEPLAPATPELVARHIACFKAAQQRASTEREQLERAQARERSRLAEERLQREREAAERVAQVEARAQAEAAIAQAQADLIAARQRAEAEAAERRRVAELLASERRTAAAAEASRSRRSGRDDRYSSGSSNPNLAVHNFDCIDVDFYVNGNWLGRVPARSQRTFVLAPGAATSAVCPAGWTSRCGRARNDFAAGASYRHRVPPAHCGARPR